MSDDIQTIEGFVALYDILGYKELIMNDDLDRVAQAYKRVKEMTTTNTLKYINYSFNREIIKVHIFSDTFLFYTYEVSDDAFYALLAASHFMFIAALWQRLPIRGATAVGNLYVSDEIQIGKPIVEAYEKEKKQEWIGCWITQDCIDRISTKSRERHLRDHIIVKYPIPLKDGKVGERYAFNWPYAFNPIADRMDPEKQGLFLKRPSHGWAEERKHRNTKEFIDYCRKLSQPSDASYFTLPMPVQL